MQVHFKIHGQGKKNLNGDGLAIWYTKERMQKGKRLITHYLSRKKHKFIIIIINPLFFSFLYRSGIWKHGQLHWFGCVC